MARWKRSEGHLTTNRKRNNSRYATYGEQRLRNKEFVFPYPKPSYANIICLNIQTVAQWQLDLRKWLSSPDSSTNHVNLCCAQHQGTTQWFFRGSLFEAWKTAGSLLWVHGKRTLFNPSPFHFLMETYL